MIIPLALDVHLPDAGLTSEQEAELRTRAADMDLLGVDVAPAEGASVPEVLSHLIMFDPAWLFSRRYIVGWVVDPIAATHTHSKEA
jgi:hypothetical protein